MDQRRDVNDSFPAESAAPLRIGGAALRVRDLAGVRDWYCRVLGLTVVAEGPGRMDLGVPGRAFLTLLHDPGADSDDPRQAGLYHTAFLMPTRADLARWIVHIARARIPVSGASDHDVSEAIYLDDPEGNGVEVYADRPPQRWRREGAIIFQKTDPLDIDAILTEIDPARANYAAAPTGLRMGHVHLRVGDCARAEAFYGGLLELELTRRRQGASFLASGGYHHHVAVNTWSSAGAGPRMPRRTGLEWVTLEIADPGRLDRMQAALSAAGVGVTPGTDGLELKDPWGIGLRLRLAAVLQGGQPSHHRGT